MDTFTYSLYSAVNKCPNVFKQKSAAPEFLSIGLAMASQFDLLLPSLDSTSITDRSYQLEK
jgi:hypothetical protein